MHSITYLKVNDYSYRFEKEIFPFPIQVQNQLRDDTEVWKMGIKEFIHSTSICWAPNMPDPVLGARSIIEQTTEEIKTPSLWSLHFRRRKKQDKVIHYTLR
jgi:hypothetical protein